MGTKQRVLCGAILIVDIENCSAAYNADQINKIEKALGV